MREEIIRMAREAWKGRGSVDAWFEECAPNFERFAALVAAAERERIAREVEDWDSDGPDPRVVAAAIRALP